MISINELYMQRAVTLGDKGTCLAYPNPSVGAVIVCDGEIIGEGYTSPYGGSHAEVNAINSVKNQSLLERSSLYLTLEPCIHHGKTPPCVDLIIKKKIPEIYVGCQDPSEKGKGKGIKILIDIGRKVQVGILKQQCMHLHRRFLNFHLYKRPYIILKWAQTADNFIDKKRTFTSLNEAKPTKISNALSHQKAHQIRAREQAIIIGTNTALKDNPLLTTRNYKGPSPMRIFIDRHLKIPTNYNLYDSQVKTFVFTEKSDNENDVEFLNIDFSKNILPQMMKKLFEKNIQSLLVEGGKQLLDSFIDQNLWNEIFIFTSKKEMKNGIKSPEVKIDVDDISYLQEDSLKHYLNKTEFYF